MLQKFKLDFVHHRHITVADLRKSQMMIPHNLFLRGERRGGEWAQSQLYHFALWTLHIQVNHTQTHLSEMILFMIINHEPQWATYRDYEACYAISCRC